MYLARSKASAYSKIMKPARHGGVGAREGAERGLAPFFPPPPPQHETARTQRGHLQLAGWLSTTCPAKKWASGPTVCRSHAAGTTCRADV